MSPTLKAVFAIAALAYLSGTPGVRPASRSALDDSSRSTTIAEGGDTLPRRLIGLDALRKGDVILSKGQTGESHAVMVISLNPHAWTHAGIVSDAGATPSLVHATPHFIVSRGSESGVERISVNLFLAQENVLAAGIFRPLQDTAGIRAADYADRLVGQGILFDQKFDLNTRTALYCTELIEQAYLEGAHLDLLAGTLPEFNVWLKARIILPDQIAQSSYLRHVGDIK